MTCAYFDAKVIGRSSGSSAVASAAYRSGQTLFDERAEKRFDYQRRDGVMHTEIMTPDGAPAWASDRQRLWNTVEATEKRKDAQLARDIIAALPRELNLEQNTAFVREFIATNFTSRGMIVDFAIHESGAGDGGKNPHVHMMLTLRPIEGDGFGKKAREWNAPDQVTLWRSSWETIQNDYLEQAGSDARISMRSYEEQGINKEPQQHTGVEAHQLEERGVETQVGDYNRSVDHRNDLREVIGDYLEIESTDDTLADATLPAAEVDADQTTRPVAAGGVDQGETGPLLSPAQEHQATLADYFRVTVERTVEAAAVLVNRLSDWFERTAEASREAFDRLLTDERSGSGRDQEWDR